MHGNTRDGLLEFASVQRTLVRFPMIYLYSVSPGVLMPFVASPVKILNELPTHRVPSPEQTLRRVFWGGGAKPLARAKGRTPDDGGWK